MARPFHLTLIFLVALTGALVFWLSLQISSSAAVEVDLDPAAATQTGPVGPAAVEARPAPQSRPAPPPGRVNPLVPLPRSGTPTLTVRPGQQVELLSAPGGEVAEVLGDTTEFGSPMVFSVSERRGNWAGVPTHLLPNGELGWIELDDAPVEIDSVDESVEVDLSAMTAEIRRDDELVRRWTVSIGGPDTPTPTGHFSITDEITEGLSSVYGCCALPISATQPNVPADWSGGNRMAIHGSTQPIGLANSIGCVRSAEEDLRALIDTVPLGTPVTIHN